VRERAPIKGLAYLDRESYSKRDNRNKRTKQKKEEVSFKRVLLKEK